MNFVLVTQRRLKLAMDELWQKVLSIPQSPAEVLRKAKAYVDSQIGTAVDSANSAAQSAARAEAQVEAMEDVVALRDEVLAAAQEASDAADAAQQAVEDVQVAIESQSLGIPNAMTVDFPAVITTGGVEPKKIKVVLYPLATALQNVVFVADNKALSVLPDGTIDVHEVGESIVYVYPALNTSLARTIRIKVQKPSVRLVSAASMRLMADGNMRLN